MPNDPGKLRLLHTADLHLGAPCTWLGDLASTRQKDFLRTFRRITECCIEHQVDLFLVAGDLFDRPSPDPSLVLSVQQECSRLLEHGITTVLLPGTHDSVWGRSSLYRTDDFPDSIILDHSFSDGPVRHLVNGIPVHLYGSAFRGEKPEELYPFMRRRDAEGFHLGMVHGSLKKAPQWECRDKDIPFTLEDLNSWGLDYVALGHYHSYQVMEQGGEVLACYPGSPEGKNFTDPGERFVALVEIDAKGARVVPLAVQTRTHASLSIDMSVESSLETLKRRIAGLADENLLLRIELTGSVDAPFDLRDILAACSDSFFYLDILDRTRFQDGALLRQLAREETIVGMCVRRFQEMLQDDPDNRETIESAMKEVVLRFHSDSGQRR